MADLIRTPPEPFLDLLAQAMERVGNRIQGFLYGDHHVIRDVNLPWEQQELWRRQGKYDETHAAMMRQIEVERLKIAYQIAIATMERPFPHQEALAEAARLALTSDPELSR